MGSRCVSLRLSCTCAPTVTTMPTCDVVRGGSFQACVCETAQHETVLEERNPRLVAALARASFGAGVMAKHHPDLIMCRKQPGICTPRSVPSHPQLCSALTPSRSLLQPSGDYARNVTASARSATHTCGRARLCAFATSATMAPTRYGLPQRLDGWHDGFERARRRMPR